MSLDLMKKNKAIPFEEDANGKIKVCFSDSSNKKSIDSIKMLLLNKGLVMEKYITFESNIEKVLRNIEGLAGQSINPNSEITGLIDSIIKTGMEKRASDIHIEPLDDSIRVRYRIDGELISVANIEKSKQTQLIGRIKAI